MEQIDLFNLPSEYNPSPEKDNSITEKDNSKTTVVIQPTKKKKPRKMSADHVPHNKIDWDFSSPLMSMVNDWKLSIWDDPSDAHMDRSLKQVRAFDMFLQQPALEDITSLDVVAFCQSMKKRDKPAKASTINRYLATLSVIFKFAKKHKMIKDTIEIEFYKEPKGRIKTYDMDQVREMRKWCIDQGEQWMADMIGLGVLTGMRLGEIEQIGKTAKLIDKGDRFVLHLPKTKNGDARDVKLSGDALVMAQRLAECKHHFTHRIFYRRWKLLRRDLKLGEDAVFHVTRHTAASFMANNLEENAFTIQAMLGHRNINTTKKYVHIDDEAEIKAADRMSQHMAL